MSMILRHTARDFGLNMNKEGFVDVEELISHPTMRNLTREDIEIVVSQDVRKRYEIVEGNEGRLHVRAVYGHDENLRVDNQLPTVSETELPAHVAIFDLKRTARRVLTYGLPGWGRNNIVLEATIPEPGKEHPRAKPRADAIFIVNTKRAIDTGTIIKKAPGGQLLAEWPTKARRQRRIMPVAIEAVWTYPGGEVIFPREDGRLPRHREWSDSENEDSDGEESGNDKEWEDGPSSDLMADVREFRTGAKYEKRDVQYTAEREEARPYYWKCSKTLNGESYLIEGRLAGAQSDTRFLLDTGANMNILPIRVYHSILAEQRPSLEKTKFDIMVGNGESMKVDGIVTTKVKFGEESYEARFYVVQESEMAVLGTSFMIDYGVKIAMGLKPTCSIRGNAVPLKREGGDIKQQVRLAKSVKIPARSENIVELRLNAGVCNGKERVIEPTRLLYRRFGVVADAALVGGETTQVTMAVCNMTEKEVVLPEKLCLGTAETVQEVTETENGTQEKRECEGEKPEVWYSVDVTTPDTELVPEHVRELYTKSIEDVREEYRGPIAELLREFQDIFATNPADIGKTTLIVHDIDTGGAAPVHQRARRQSPDENAGMKGIVENLRSVGIIEPSKSAWASNVRMVKKKDGTWRMCVDYRELNDKTVIRDPYSLPRIDAMLDNLADAKMFSCLDLIWGYHQVPLTAGASERTAFITPQMSPSHWQYVYMPFGLRDAPATFQRLVDKMLAGIQYDYAMAYLDDIIVKGQNEEDSIEHLREVFRRVRAANLKLKPSKCDLFRKKISYLGHIIGGEGVQTDPKKVKAVKEWPIPIYLTDVRGFIGLCSYYRRFINNFSELVKPLSNLTTKHSDRVWREEHTQAFLGLKQALTEAPVLAHPQPGRTYILDTDASTWGIGAVLSQLQPHGKANTEQERPIAYASRLLLPRELNYCARRRELLAIYEWTQYFSHYLAGQRFVIRTDHDSLKGLNNLAKLPGQFARWIEYLNGFSFDIKVRKGAEHSNADFLSRIFGDCFCKGREIFEQTESAREALRDEPVRDWELFERCAQEVANRRVKYQGSEIIKIMDERAQTMLRDRDLRDELEVASKVPRRVPELAAREVQPRARQHDLRPGRMNLETTWTKDALRQAQKNDPDMKMLYELKHDNGEKPGQCAVSGLSAAGKSYMRDWALIRMKDDLLYRYYEDAARSEKYYQLLVPECYQQELLVSAHDQGTTKHMGYRRTLTAIQLRYYWHDLRSQLRVYTRTCAVCQRKRGRNVNTRQRLTGHLPGYRNERVYMDVCGTFVTSRLGNKYLLVICDAFTKYVTAVPVQDTRAITLADAFLRGWCNVYGYPTEVHTDRGTYFTSEFWAEMCRRMGLKHTLGAAHRAQSNAQNERQIRAVQESLRVAMDGHAKKDWDVRVSYATAAYNFTPHSVTRFAPHELMFGELPQMELDLQAPRPEQMQWEQAEYLQYLKHLMRDTFRRVREHLRRAMETRKERYDSSIRTARYMVGGKVALKMVNKVVGYDKLDDRYEGPYHVLSIWGNGAVRIQMTEKSGPKIVHADRLEPWKSDPTERQPEWVQRAIKKYGPSRRETGVQVEFTLERGEVQECTLNGSEETGELGPVMAQTRREDTCRECKQGGIDGDGVLRVMQRTGLCQICNKDEKRNWRRSEEERDDEIDNL